jgi:two-component system, cell cycle response regulator
MANLANKRIFIVEDNVMNLAVFATSLRKSGASVVQDAWNTGTVDMLVDNLPIDLVVLDIMLRKDINGYDVFDQIRANPKTAHIPVVGVSSLDAETEIPKAKARGFDGFIGKPINALAFPDQVAQVLNGEKIWVFSN